MTMILYSKYVYSAGWLLARRARSHLSTRADGRRGESNKASGDGRRSGGARMIGQHRSRLRHVALGLAADSTRSLKSMASGGDGGGSSARSRRVGLLGLGAIGEVVAKALLREPAATGCPPAGDSPEPDGIEGAALCAILVSDTAKHADKASWLPADVLLTSDSEAFFAAAPEVIVEAAGQPTVISYGERALAAGCDFIVTSTGALTDDSLHERLRSAATGSTSGRLHLASGAMPGLDWMQAAAMGGGVSRLSVVQSKPPTSWHGTVAEEAVLAVDDWESHGPLTIFEGPARSAASAFPKSSNVTATLALATVGLDATSVRLVADPQPFFSTSLELESSAGTIKIEAKHLPSPSNPKTSSDVALSVLRSLRATCSSVYVGT